MDRRTGIRLTIAAGLAIGLSFSVTPQLVSGSTGSGPATEATSARPSITGDQVWPVDLHPATPVTAPEVVEVVEVDDADEIGGNEASAVQVTPDPEPAPEPAAPVAVPVPAPAPAPVVEDEMTTGSSIHVDVTTADGAARAVSLKTADGALVGGPVAVDGNRITFSDVADGSYDLYVEQTADGGGTFLTRTTLVVSGVEIVVTCDDETLDCTVA